MTAQCGQRITVIKSCGGVPGREHKRLLAACQRLEVATKTGQCPTAVVVRRSAFGVVCQGIVECGERLLVASGVVSSGPILAALSEAIDRGMRLGGLYDRPQMDQVRRQWHAAHVGADKINTWDKVADHLVGKNSLAYNRNRPQQPHNFMHNKLVVADDVVVTGSFNLSNHAMSNCEDVLFIHDAGVASAYAAYLEALDVLVRDVSRRHLRAVHHSRVPAGQRLRQVLLRRALHVQAGQVQCRKRM